MATKLESVAADPTVKINAIKICEQLSFGEVSMVTSPSKVYFAKLSNIFWPCLRTNEPEEVRSPGKLGKVVTTCEIVVNQESVSPNYALHRDACSVMR